MKEFLHSAFKNIKYLTRKMSASRIGAYAGQTAFFMFLSFIPLIMLLLSLINRFTPEGFYIADTTNEFLPNAITSFLKLYLNEIIDESRLSLTIVSSFVLLWSASKGIFAIIGGLNSIYEIKETRGYFFLRAVSLIYTIIFLGILISALTILVFGNMINQLLYSLFPNLKGLVYIISSLRFIIGFVLLVLFFSILFKALPSGKQNFFDQIPGAVITSAGWVSFSIMFSFFIDNFSNYSNLYGSLTAIIVLLLWLYVCMYIMFIGAEINLILTNKAKNSL